MNYVLEFRPEVCKELDDAYNWYENQQTGLGEDFLNCIDKYARFHTSNARILPCALP
jgi:hypothetical protein